MDKEVILTGGEFYLKKEGLKKIEVDKENWTIFYVDETNNEKWIEEYPFAEMQGGGFPQLRLVEKFPWE
ncbi:MAG: hypothetical protein H7258_12875 [Ferruginibacter sp.]|nr:hypothetical protein [Ferruginibacter sp.]